MYPAFYWYWDTWLGTSFRANSSGSRRLAHLLQQGYDLGVNFWDVADQYGSHPHIARALA